jgi:hypothetical protein
LPYVSSPDQQLVARNLGISRSLAERRDKKFRPAVHGDVFQSKQNPRL